MAEKKAGAADEDTVVLVNDAGSTVTLDASDKDRLDVMAAYGFKKKPARSSSHK
jgi:hypothetical protein